MVLKSIEISGFKSFAKKHTLSFDKPVVAVVGPNGSGKSNVVESFRFVLGEQSIKSMRSKSGADLIFKGSKQLSQLARASVSITFNNKKKLFTFTGDGEKNISLDFDEVTITREVFRDGTNKYAINGTDVRLKDIVDLLASVHIGASGHHIISQGEADRILSANSKERRVMIEDALGLKIYQYKIKESERKLEKTRANMKEVSAIRRELAPHINFLKKQVDKIAKTEEFRTELRGLYREYLGKEAYAIHSLSQKNKHSVASHNQELERIKTRIQEIQATRNQVVVYEEEQLIKEKRQELQKIATLIDETSRAIGRLEGMITLLESDTADKKIISIATDRVKEVFEKITLLADEHVSDEKLREHLAQIRITAKQFIETELVAGKNTENKQDKLAEYQTSKEQLADQLAGFTENRAHIENSISDLEKVLTTKRSEKPFDDTEYFALIKQQSEIEAGEQLHQLEQQNFEKRTHRFEEERKEASVLIGIDILNYEEIAGEINEEEHEGLRRKIERMKIRLEEAGIVSGNDVLKEYDETIARDQFLSKELQDIDESILHLTRLIADLRETLDREFKEGVEKINQRFQEFFDAMFGGGSAFLSISVEHKKPSKNMEEDEDDTPVKSDVEEQEFRFEQGVEIHVNLPHKKVKDLQMLSGGERSLTSIALLFAMSQVTPPPFLVLDETDAALDEANSRRYGDMIERLSKHTQLVVVTHNRETMSRAGLLYGVTVGADGGSKLLCVKFDEAEQYAK